MANHKSAAKRARQDEKKRARNLSIKKTVRTFEKKLRTAITDKKAGEAESALKLFVSKMDKAAQKGVYHSKTAARKISRLASQVNTLK